MHFYLQAWPKVADYVTVCAAHALAPDFRGAYILINGKGPRKRLKKNADGGWEEIDTDFFEKTCGEWSRPAHRKSTVRQKNHAPGRHKVHILKCQALMPAGKPGKAHFFYALSFPFVLEAC
jgi:hypothetical protein